MLDENEITCEIQEYATQANEWQTEMEANKNYGLSRNLACRYANDIVQLLVQLKEKTVLYDHEVKTIYDQKKEYP